MKTTKTMLGIIAGVVVIGVIITAYGVSTLYNAPPKHYTMRIYLHDNENITQQLDNISRIIQDFYKTYYQAKEVVMPTLSILESPSRNVTPPEYVETFVSEPMLSGLVHALESNGFTVTYQEQYEPEKS